MTTVAVTNLSRLHIPQSWSQILVLIDLPGPAITGAEQVL